MFSATPLFIRTLFLYLCISIIHCDSFKWRVINERANRIQDAIHQLPQISFTHRSLLQADVSLRLAWLATTGPASELAELLEDVDADLKYNGTPPIWRAAANDNLATVTVLIEAGANVDAINNNGTTALYIASQLGYTQIVEALLEADADPNVASVWGSTALTVAVIHNHDNITESLVDAGADVSIEISGSGQSVLWIAASNGNVEIVGLLLENGADINQTDTSGASPLYAAVANGHLDVVELLLAELAGPDVARQDGNTPLHVASAACSIDIVNALLLAGASSRISNEDDQTPLDIACMNEDERSMLRLDIEGQLSPLIGAARAGNLDMVKIIVQTDDPNEQVRSGKTALMYAAEKGDAAMVVVLVEANADHDIIDGSNRTALHYAADVQSSETVMALNEADANVIDAEGQTPLMVAVNRSDADVTVVEALLSIGARTNIRSPVTGNTALHLAAEYGHVEIVRVLIEAGARRQRRNRAGARPIDVMGTSAEISEGDRNIMIQLLSSASPRSTATANTSPDDVTGDAGVRINPSNTISAGQANSLDLTTEDDDDTFSSGGVIAFLIVPPAVLFCCMAAYVLYHRHPIDNEAPKPIEPELLLPDFGNRRERHLDDHFRVTERELRIPVQIPDRQQRSIPVDESSLVEHSTSMEGHHSLEGTLPESADQTRDAVDTSSEHLRREDIPSIMTQQHRGILDPSFLDAHQRLENILPEDAHPSRDIAHEGNSDVVIPVDVQGETTEGGLVSIEHQSGSIGEASLDVGDTFDHESDEYKDARDRFSSVGSLVSTAKSDEFKDALENPEISTQSSDQAAMEAFSLDGGTSSLPASIMTTPSFDFRPLVESYALGPSEVRSRTTSSESTVQHEPTVEPVTQMPPSVIHPIDSFALQTFSDTTSMDSTSLTPPTSRDVSLEEQRPLEGPMHVPAMNAPTGRVPALPIPEGFSLDQLRAEIEEASRSVDGDGLPSIRGHRISIGSLRSSIDTQGRTSISEEQPNSDPSQ